MRIVEIVESVENSKDILDENKFLNALGSALGSLFKGGAKGGEKVLDKVLDKPGAAVKLGAGATGTYVAADHADQALDALGKKVGPTVDQITKSTEQGAGLLTDIFTALRVPFNDPMVQQWARYAAQYAIPVGLVALLAIGGKKMYDYLTTSNTDKEKTAEDLLESIFQERGAATRALCLSKRSDASIGASALASCKSQGLRPRDGKKSHKLGKKRVQVGGRKIKGRAHGGPLPDWS